MGPFTDCPSQERNKKTTIPRSLLKVNLIISQPEIFLVQAKKKLLKRIRAENLKPITRSKERTRVKRESVFSPKLQIISEKPLNRRSERDQSREAKPAIIFCTSTTHARLCSGARTSKPRFSVLTNFIFPYDSQFLFSETLSTIMICPLFEHDAFYAFDQVIPTVLNVCICENVTR